MQTIFVVFLTCFSMNNIPSSFYFVFSGCNYAIIIFPFSFSYYSSSSSGYHSFPNLPQYILQIKTSLQCITFTHWANLFHTYSFTLHSSAMFLSVPILCPVIFLWCVITIITKNVLRHKWFNTHSNIIISVFTLGGGLKFQMRFLPWKQ